MQKENEKPMPANALTPFHYAFYVKDLKETEDFYGNILGAKIGRKSDTWVDFSLFGHQLSAHFGPDKCTDTKAGGNVDGKLVPMPHFGVVLPMDKWNALAKSLDNNPAIKWVIEPHIRFEGQPGEQGTFFLMDPSGNALEFKGFADLTTIFEG